MPFETNPMLEGINKPVLLRYQLIEIIAYWEGRLTTNHLTKGFDIVRNQASRDIKTYLEVLAPGNLVYDMQLRGYKPSESFRPVVTKGDVNEYLHLLSLNQRLVSKHNYTTVDRCNVSSVRVPTRLIDPIVMRAIVRAIIQGDRLEIDYLSMDNPEPETRVIAPHTIVETPLRWHVRAYCEKNRAYRDFVLSRFVNQPELIGDSENPMCEDSAWGESINIVLQADPRLNDHQRALIERDYDMQDGELVIETRLALVNYQLSSLGLNVFDVHRHAEYQQVQIKNVEEIKQALTLANMLPQ